MTDLVSTAKRSEMMAGIKARDTKPELLIRRGLWARGYRYRKHVRDLPGKPDLVFSRYRAVIFVHGCFWHRHDCPLFKWPSSRQEFWRNKLNGNAKRDEDQLQALEKQGWRVLIIWECALKGRGRHDPDSVLDAVESWLATGTEFDEIGGRF